MKGGQETLFVKNLENVQGDERDVIFISTTYGVDERGNQFQRFGPINTADGHRRLNVLFTRSKSRTVVFSSIDPDRIQTTNSSPWGLRAFKRYLTYARTGILKQSDDTSGQPTNDFERSVAMVLKEKGFDVVSQVGVAGFFIDVAVKHPAKCGAFLLGIECDGATYHASKSARDRDRLREEILVNLGWTIYRVWSTDWFKSRDTEVRKLVQAIEKLLAKDPAYVSQRNTVLGGQALLQQLVGLRDREIAEDFPDTSPEKNLLSDTLIRRFVEVRPTTKEDWFRMIPHEIRENVDSRQVGKYLNKVFEIIASHRG
jgi:very-short-patch-repair endonuclease